MKKLMILVCSIVSLRSAGQVPTETYPADSASIEHPGVPKGELRKYSFSSSKIFPGTTRDYWVYVPAQYTGKTPACLYVNQDGVQFKAPTVFDNLINSREMPVTIGVFVTPGIVKAVDTLHAIDRFNRSFEYDGLGNNYVRFLLEELLPEVERLKTADGRPVRLSHNANDRAIGGSSSGAVCAFTAAWERPDAFSRVYSAIGTYVSLRGADRYPGLIRKYEPKPIRVFLQDGSNDLNIYAGDWWKANETMERALTFSGYEVQHLFGQGAHNNTHPGVVFPEAMRWLWKNYPQPVRAGRSKNEMLSDLMIEGEGWQLVGQGYHFTEGSAADPHGNVVFQDIPASKTYAVDNEGKVSELKIDSKKSSGTAFGADGSMFTVAGATRQVLERDRNGVEKVVVSDISGNDLVLCRNGNIYVTSPDGSDKPGKVYLVRPGGATEVVDEGLRFPNGLALSGDQTQLFVTESASHWLWVYQILPDGHLAGKQRFGWLHAADDSEFAWPDGVRCDTSGRIYVATRLGIQILDQLGRVNAILPLPSAGASNLCFGGRNFDVLYVTCVDKVYRRKLHTRGANNFELPVKPSKPRL